MLSINDHVWVVDIERTGEFSVEGAIVEGFHMVLDSDKSVRTTIDVQKDDGVRVHAYYSENCVFTDRDKAIAFGIASAERHIEIIRKCIEKYRLGECDGFCDFFDDAEKMRDFFMLSKKAFLSSYSYLSEEDYELTEKKVKELREKGEKTRRE